jgi:hypothetical protein
MATRSSEVPAGETGRGRRGVGGDLSAERGSRILPDVRELRQHFIARFFVCVLLTWTAVDLLVPQLCDAESLSKASAPSSAPSQGADCFCCSHAVDTVKFEVVFVDGVTVIVDDCPPAPLSPGVSPRLYHPPIQS